MRLLSSLALLSFIACSSASAPAPEAQTRTPKEIPITSKSPEAVEHFKKARDFADNLRQLEATTELNQALKLDPDFALALAYRGAVTPGSEGLSDIEQAQTKASTASKEEQMLIEAMLTGRRVENTKSEELWTQLAEAMSDDWRVHMGRGAQLYGSQKYDEAITSLTRATMLNPSAGPAFNMLGYSYLVKGQTAPAVEALKKYAALNPNEPNPQDSLGEALMAAGQMAEAEAAFRRAAGMGTGFPIAWEGVAYTKFFSGDWAGGRQALAEARKGNTRPVDRTNTERLSIAATFAEGRTAEGLKQLDALVASADATPIDAAFAPVYRGMVLVESSKYKEAAAEGMKAVQSSGGKLPPFVAGNLDRWGWAIQAAAAGLSHDAAGAQKVADGIQAAAAKRADDPQLRSAVDFAQGMVAATKKDMATARMHFDRCSDSDTYCLWQSTVVSEKSGDKAGADASRARLTRLYQRDPIYLYARSRVGGKKTASN